jgi:hypothetical protein
VVAFSCKARAVCPSCLGRRMSAGAANLVDHVLPDVPIRQFVVTMPFPLRFPLAFDGKLLGEVLRIFTDTVTSWYRRRHRERGLPDGETGAVTAIQRANGDLRLSPHFHTLCLDGLYSPDRDGKGLMFHPAPAPSQEDIEQLALRVSKRILRFLQRRGVITLVTAPGDGEVTVVPDETLGEQDPLLAKLLAAATTGAASDGPASKRQPVRVVLDPDERPVAKGALCGQSHGFNLQGATRVAANDKPGRERLCRYILRPPLAYAWGAGRLCRPRTIAGRFGNPLRVSILETGCTSSTTETCAWISSDHGPTAPRRWTFRRSPSSPDLRRWFRLRGGTSRATAA